MLCWFLARFEVLQSAHFLVLFAGNSIIWFGCTFFRFFTTSIEVLFFAPILILFVAPLFYLSFTSYVGHFVAHSGALVVIHFVALVAIHFVPCFIYCSILYCFQCATCFPFYQSIFRASCQSFLDFFRPSPRHVFSCTFRGALHVAFSCPFVMLIVANSVVLFVTLFMATLLLSYC